MPIQLDEQRKTSNRPPVVEPRHVGAVVNFMVIDKEQRDRRTRNGDPILNAKGRPAQEEVITILVLDGTTGTVTGGDLEDDYAPNPGDVCRIIVKGRDYGALIDARKPLGSTNVGDVVSWTARSAVIWRDKGDILKSDVTDSDTIAKARAKGHTISWDRDVTYRRSTPDEHALVAKCEALWHERQQAKAINLDSKPSVDDLEDF